MYAIQKHSRKKGKNLCIFLLVKNGASRYCIQYFFPAINNPTCQKTGYYKKRSFFSSSSIDKQHHTQYITVYITNCSFSAVSFPRTAAINFSLIMQWIFFSPYYGWISFFLNIFWGDFFYLFPYNIQHCFICRPSDSTVPTDAGIEPRTVATGALTARRSNH